MSYFDLTETGDQVRALREIADALESAEESKGIDRDEVESAASDIRSALDSMDAEAIGGIPDNYIREIESVASSVQSEIESAMGDIESALDQLDSLLSS